MSPYFAAQMIWFSAVRLQNAFQTRARGLRMRFFLREEMRAKSGPRRLPRAPSIHFYLFAYYRAACRYSDQVSRSRLEARDLSAETIYYTICVHRKCGYAAASPRQCGCPHWQEISVFPCRDSQCGLQYFSLSGGTQLQAGLAHFFVSAIEISFVPCGALALGC